MAESHLPDALAGLKLQRDVDFERDSARGGGDDAVATLVVYGDYLCPYCREVRLVLAELRRTLGKQLIYAFRQFPNERIHPGAQFLASAAIAAGAQGRFWPMHDWIYAQDLPIADEQVFAFAAPIGVDADLFRLDVASDATRGRIDEDIADGIANGVTGTPTFFIDGLRYDGAWDFHSMLEALQLPVAAQVQRSARVFASLPASAGIVLLLAAVAAIACANTSIAPYYHALMNSAFSVGPPGRAVSMTVGAWCSEGLLAFFFLLVGLEIRREITVGALTNPRVALLPVLAAVGGVIVPAAVYLAISMQATAHGWSVPTATDVAFTLGILALLGKRIPVALRVFIAALAVVDDILSMVTLAIFYPRAFEIDGVIASVAAVAVLYALNRARVYVGWPYALVAGVLWISLHVSGIHAALAGVLLAAFLPTRPAPDVAPLLAQAATALDALQKAEADGVRGTAK